MPALFGQHDRYLARIERRLGVNLSSRGNVVVVEGPAAARALARAVMNRLYQRLKDGLEIGPGDVDGAMRMEEERQNETNPPLTIRTRQRTIVARSPNQQRYLEAMQANDLVFGLGPAGTGKTYLAVAMAVSALMRGEKSRIILSRPAVEAGERLGFLPGDLREKVDPYLRPLYDALYDMLPAEQVVRRLESGEIEIAPLAFMRGRTLANAFIIIDEAQNTTAMQMKMLLTRLGENARMVVTGDLTQIDLPRGEVSGLREATGILEGVPGIGFVRFEKADIVRHPLVTRMVEAYEAHEKRDKTGD
ncbi:MAG: PhoH family protein [Alphaproteobacteria bacterium]